MVATDFVVGGECLVSPQGEVGINVLDVPSNDGQILTEIEPGSQSAVIARQADNSWYLINGNGELGWVPGGVVSVVGDCADVAIVGATVPTAAPAPLEVGPTAEPSPTEQIFGGLPDLTVNSISLVMDRLHSDITIFVTIANQGAGASEPTTLEVLVDGNVLMVEVPAVAANRNTTVIVVAQNIDQSADLSINVTLDPENTVAEGDETNNTRSTLVDN